jgi:transposase InsO family protein
VTFVGSGEPTLHAGIGRMIREVKALTDLPVAVILDAYSHGLRGWNLGRSLEKELTIGALKMALEHHLAPEIHHSDQEKQYAATGHTDLLGTNVTISMPATGQPA